MHIIEFFGRLFLSALFLIEGSGKISMREDVIMYMEEYGVPGILFIPATALEILFPLFLILGYKTKWAASIMAIFTFVVAILGGNMLMYFLIKNFTEMQTDYISVFYDSMFTFIL